MVKILVCHTGAWIGDQVLLTPTLRGLKQYYPVSHLSILLRPHVADLMRANPYVDSCIVDIRQEGFFTSVIRLTRRIKHEDFDICVVLHPTSYRNALIPFLARIPSRIGSDYKWRRFLLTASCPFKSNIHEVNRYLSVLSLLKNVSAPNLSYTPTPELEYWHTDADRMSIRELLRREGVLENDKLIAVNVGTTWQTKKWEIRNFESVIREISNRIPDRKIVITGSISEQYLIDRLPSIDSTINFVGKTDILQLGALLERCELCLTCDSGPMHIAAAVGTPCIALFGPTDPIRHEPYGKGHTIVEKQVSCRPCYKRSCQRKDKPNLCMNEIKTTEVIDKIIRIINRKN